MHYCNAMTRPHDQPWFGSFRFFQFATLAPAAGSQPQPQYKDSHFIGISSFPYMFYNIKHTIFFVDREHIPIRLVGASPGEQRSIAKVGESPGSQVARVKTGGGAYPFAGKERRVVTSPKKSGKIHKKSIW